MRRPLPLAATIAVLATTAWAQEPLVLTPPPAQEVPLPDDGDTAPLDLTGPAGADDDTAIDAPQSGTPPRPNIKPAAPLQNDEPEQPAEDVVSPSESLQQPSLTEGEALPPSAETTGGGEDEPDLAYGAFQRGYYLSALSLAIPRAEAGDLAAQTLLGVIYEGGYGIPPDHEEAAAWYELAAIGGDREAQFALAMMYLEGRGVDRDRRKAAEYFEKAAVSGKVAAMYNLALLRLDGSLGEQDVQGATELLIQAAEAGSADSKYVLAQLYDEGRGVPRDRERATALFSEAAAVGHTTSQVEYAIRLFNGVGVEVDEEVAAGWFRRAAEAGNPIAQNRLARLLSAGRGVPADPIEAATWHFRAVAAGKSDAMLDEFVEGLTEEQRQAARAEAERFFPH